MATKVPCVARAVDRRKDQRALLWLEVSVCHAAGGAATDSGFGAKERKGRTLQ